MQFYFFSFFFFLQENAEMLNETKRLQEFFDEDFRDVFNIS